MDTDSRRGEGLGRGAEAGWERLMGEQGNICNIFNNNDFLKIFPIFLNFKNYFFKDDMHFVMLIRNTTGSVAFLVSLDRILQTPEDTLNKMQDFTVFLVNVIDFFF